MARSDTNFRNVLIAAWAGAKQESMTKKVPQAAPSVTDSHRICEVVLTFLS